IQALMMFYPRVVNMYDSLAEIHFFRSNIQKIRQFSVKWDRNAESDQLSTCMWARFPRGANTMVGSNQKSRNGPRAHPCTIDFTCQLSMMPNGKCKSVLGLSFLWLIPLSSSVLSSLSYPQLSLLDSCDKQTSSLLNLKTVIGKWSLGLTKLVPRPFWTPNLDPICRRLTPRRYLEKYLTTLVWFSCCQKCQQILTYNFMIANKQWLVKNKYELPRPNTWISKMNLFQFFPIYVNAFPKNVQFISQEITANKTYGLFTCKSKIFRTTEYFNKIQNNCLENNFKSGYVIKRSIFQLQKSCDNLYKSGKTTTGVYTIDPDGLEAFAVRCDMETTPGWGWTVFQRRVDGSEDFYRNWTDYKTGFGNLSGEFWLGLDKIHRLSASGHNVLKIDLESFENKTAYAVYQLFSVGNENKAYILNVGNYSANFNRHLSK
ncbi:Hypothetical predicted protein, partial [Paramuricea clavata]